MDTVAVSLITLTRLTRFAIMAGIGRPPTSVASSSLLKEEMAITARGMSSGSRRRVAVFREVVLAPERPHRGKDALAAIGRGASNTAAAFLTKPLTLLNRAAIGAGIGRPLLSVARRAIMVTALNNHDGGVGISNIAAIPRGLDLSMISTFISTIFH